MLSLNARIRDIRGKQNKKLRRDGFIPGILYGKKNGSISLHMAYKEFEQIYNEAGENTLISLIFKEDQQVDSQEEAKETVVLIRDAVVHPVTRYFIHVDFFQVPMDKEIYIEVPLEYTNEAPAVKNEGATIIRNLYKIEIKALPKDLPQEIIVDLSKLEHVNDSITLKDLQLPAGVSIESEDDYVIVSASLEEQEEIPTEAEEELIPDSIKTEAEERREEKEAEGEGVEQ
jgi:large subunit ribosomal protein L25